jgi:hypothetical protein
MVTISTFGSGEGLVWVTGRGYSTTFILATFGSTGPVGVPGCSWPRRASPQLTLRGRVADIAYLLCYNTNIINGLI